jgi:hypothetical protein
MSAMFIDPKQRTDGGAGRVARCMLNNSMPIA